MEKEDQILINVDTSRHDAINTPSALNPSTTSSDNAVLTASTNPSSEGNDSLAIVAAGSSLLLPTSTSQSCQPRSSTTTARDSLAAVEAHAPEEKKLSSTSPTQIPQHSSADYQRTNDVLDWSSLPDDLRTLGRPLYEASIRDYIHTKLLAECLKMGLTEEYVMELLIPIYLLRFELKLSSDDFKLMRNEIQTHVWGELGYDTVFRREPTLHRALLERYSQTPQHFLAQRMEGKTREATLRARMEHFEIIILIHTLYSSAAHYQAMNAAIDVLKERQSRIQAQLEESRAMECQRQKDMQWRHWRLIAILTLLAAMFAMVNLAGPICELMDNCNVTASSIVQIVAVCVSIPCIIWGGWETVHWEDVSVEFTKKLEKLAIPPTEQEVWESLVQEFDNAPAEQQERKVA